MPRFADQPDEIFPVGNRKVYIYLTTLEDGRVAVDYEARPAVIERALDAPPSPRRRVYVGKDRADALRIAKERFRLMFHMRKLHTVDPGKLRYH